MKKKFATGAVICAMCFGAMNLSVFAQNTASQKMDGLINAEVEIESETDSAKEAFLMEGETSEAEITAVEADYSETVDERVVLTEKEGTIVIQADKNTGLDSIKQSLVFQAKTSDGNLLIESSQADWNCVIEEGNKPYNPEIEGTYKYQLTLPQFDGYTYAEGKESLDICIEVVMNQLHQPIYAGWKNNSSVAEWKDSNNYKEAYQLKLYKDGNVVETVNISDVENTLSYDFGPDIAAHGKGSYTFGVSTVYNGVYQTSEEKISGEIIVYQISYNKNTTASVTNLPAATVFINGNKAVKPSKTPARKGYNFVGWYTDKEGKTAFVFSKKLKANTLLYAKWKKVTVEKPASFKVTKKDNKKSSYNVKLSWKKVSGADGYQISYSYKKSTGKTVTKTKTISNPKTTSATIGISYSKAYTFKIRAYKYDSLSKKIYSSYSSKKKMTYPEKPVCALKVDSDLKYYKGERVRLYFSNMEKLKPDGVKITFGEKTAVFKLSEVPIYSVTLKYTNRGSHSIEVSYYRNINGKKVFSEKTSLTYKN